MVGVWHVSSLITTAMDREVQQLLEMVQKQISSQYPKIAELTCPRQGATAAQARAALRQYKDVMQAAEKIFEGKFDDVVDSDLTSEVDIRDALDGNKASRMVVGISATTHPMIIDCFRRRRTKTKIPRLTMTKVVGCTV